MGDDLNKHNSIHYSFEWRTKWMHRRKEGIGCMEYFSRIMNPVTKQDSLSIIQGVNGLN